MSLSSPLIDSGMKEDACRWRMRRCKKRSRAAATCDVDVDPRRSHETAEVLSQKIPMCWCLRSVNRASMTSHPRTIPANSRSLIVMLPCNFASLISSGHSSFQTMYGTTRDPGTTTPPAPILHASVYFRMEGRSGTRSWIGVGTRVMCWTSALQSSSARRRSFVMVTNSGSPLVAIYMGENNPRPPWMARDACCNLPASS